jgi:hypothetical protein
MTTPGAREIYKRYVSSLPASERLRLLAMLAQGLASEATEPSDADERPRRNIMELHGLGKEIWEGIDAQKYVDQLRNEWEPSSTSNEAR